MTKVAILDDYAGVALDLADWSPVRSRAQVAVFDHHLSENEAVEALQPFDVICTGKECGRLCDRRKQSGVRIPGLQISDLAVSQEPYRRGQAQSVRPYVQRGRRVDRAPNGGGDVQGRGPVL